MAVRSGGGGGQDTQYQNITVIGTIDEPKVQIKFGTFHDSNFPIFLCEQGLHQNWGNGYTYELTILYNKPQKTAHFIMHMLFYGCTIHLIDVQVESFTAHNP